MMLNFLKYILLMKYYRHNDYLFKEKRLGVPKCYIRDLLVREAHAGGLMGRFGVQKTLETLHKHFYWSCMKHDMYKFFTIALFVKRQNQK